MATRPLGPTNPTLPAALTSPGSALDYYLVSPAGPDEGQRGEPEVILVEELEFDADRFTLYSAGWSPTTRRWWSASAFSRAMRADAGLRGRVAVISRREAEAAYLRLGADALPGEELLRTYFDEGQTLSTSAPLRLTAAQPAPGFHESRIYRILFANELDAQGLADVQATWAMTIVADPEDPRARVIGTSTQDVDGDRFTWDLRRIGTGVAWCLDLTVHVADGRGVAIEPVLRGLINEMRQHRLIPAVVERLS